MSPTCFQFWELAFRQIKMNATISEDTRLCRCICCFCKLRVTNSYIVYFLVPLVLLSLFWKGQQSTKVACQRTRAQFQYEKVTGVHWPKGGMIYSARKIVQTVFCISTAKTLQAVKDNLTKDTKSGLHNCTDNWHWNRAGLYLIHKSTTIHVAAAHM